MEKSDIERARALVGTLIEVSGIANKLSRIPEVSVQGQRAELHIRIAIGSLRRAIEVLDAKENDDEGGNGK